MRYLMVIVCFQLVVSFDIVLAFLPNYQVANQDLIKGILLGALLTSQKHPSQLLSYMPVPYYHQGVHNSYMTPPSQYGYTTPAQTVEQNQVNRDYEYRERPSDQSNGTPQQTDDRQQDSTQQNTETYGQSESQPLRQHSEPLYEPQVTDPPTSPPSRPIGSQTNSNRIPIEPVIPSMESIQQNLGLPSHSVILMILPTAEDKSLTEKAESKKSVTTNTKSEQTREITDRGVDEQQISSTERIRTNAVRVGSKQLNPRGWKPVPKTIPTITTSTTTTSTTTESALEGDNRFDRFHMNRYIDRSVRTQFGLRNRDRDHYQRWPDMSQVMAEEEDQ